MIRKIPASLALLLLTAAVSIFFLLVAAKTSIVESSRLKTIDGLFALRASLTKTPDSVREILIVGVDDESFVRMNRSWPWSRDIFAYFLEKLNAQEPKVVAFDFVFGGSGGNAEADEWWAKTIRLSDRVILASYIGPDGKLVLPHPKFADAALGMGLVDKPQDVDGVTRKTRPVFEPGSGDSSFSMAMEVLARSNGQEPRDRIVRSNGQLRYFRDGKPRGAGDRGEAVQTDPRGRAWLSFRYRPERFVYAPFWRVMMGGIPAEQVRGKVVLVGPVSPLFHDIHQTPLGSMPGLFAMANELMALKDGDFIREPFAGAEVYWVTLFGLLFALLIFRWSFIAQWIIFIASCVVVYGASAAAFCVFNILIDPFYPIVILILNFILVASWKALKTFLDNAALQRQVITDSLTGLYGHRFLTLKLGSVFLHSAQTKQEFCVAMLDADHFKKVNDTYGHDVGNQVLIGITKVMKQHVRRQDIAARFGGEEFCVMFIGTDTKGAREGLERMRRAIEELEFTSDKGKFKVTISAGLASNQNPAVKNSDDLLKLADKALYQAKQEGRNRVCTA